MAEMPGNQVWGIGWTLLAGAMQGGFPFPMKFTRRWQFDHIWLVSSLLGLVLFPWLIALRTIPGLAAVLDSIPARSAAVVCLFGAGWGVGGLLFGQGVHRVGLSLATGIVLGLTSAVGSLVPMILFHAERVISRTGAILMAAIAIATAGILLCTYAGLLRERRMAADPKSAGFRRGSFRAGIAICIASGLLSPLFNFALICGGDVIAAARAGGALPADAPNLIWAIAMTGGLIPTAAFCGWSLTRARTWGVFAGSPMLRDPALAVVMGLLFAYGNSFYGTGAEFLGNLGPILGWPVFMAMQVVTGNVLGLATGEWQGAGRAPLRSLALGVAALVVAIFVIAQAET